VDPNSGRSDSRGLTFVRLPSEGHVGEVPEFPLPDQSVREDKVWQLVWTYPQAEAWSREPWRWLTVAMYVRTLVVCETHDATAADKASLHRFADQIGLTPAGMRENGWIVSSDEVGQRRDERPAQSKRERRLRAVSAER
jgi:hypothetical protein